MNTEAEGKEDENRRLEMFIGGKYPRIIASQYTGL